MTLLVPKNRPGPVFDCIAQLSVNEKFPVRRLPTLAQKSLLSEKHIPFKPSASPFFRKCYCSNSLQLYKLNKDYKHRNTFIEMLSPERRCEQFIQFHDPNKFAKIRHTVHEMPLLELPLLITAQRGNFSELSFTASVNLHIQDAILEHDKFHNKNYSFDLISPPENLTIKNRPSSLNVSATSRATYVSTCPRNIHSFFAQSFYQPHLSLACYGPINHLFVFFSGHNKNFPLQLTTKNLSTTNLKKFVQATSQMPENFQPKIEKSHAHFDFRNEIGKNLIIGTRPEITTLISVKSHINTLPHSHSASMRTQNKSGLIKHSSPTSHETQLQTREPVFFQTLVVRPSLMLRAPQNNQLPKPRSQLLATFRARVADKTSWLRLKLRLHKCVLVSPAPVPSIPAIKRTALACISGSNALNKIQLSMPPKIGERPLKIRQEAFAQIFSRVSFCRKTDQPLFKTRSQAIYTKKLMRKLIAVEAFKKSRKQYFAPGQLGYFTLATNLAKTFTTKSSALLENITHIRTRPLHFLMQISAMNFTDIELPLNRRRLVPPQGLFPSSFALNAKPGSLMPLRLFLASSVTAQQRLSSNTLKPIRRICPSSVPLKHFALPVHELSLNSDYLLRVMCREKKVNIVTRAITQRFHYNSSVPDSICERLKLSFAILDDNHGARRLLLDFSAPPDWEKSWRKFSCKLRLMPFPFGFPCFSHRHFLPKLMSSPFAPQPQSESVTNIKAQPLYSFSNAKHYYHPLSQKMPKRWLYSFALDETFKAENYKRPFNELFLDVSAPRPLKEFAYNWYVQKTAKLFYPTRPLDQNKIWPEKIYLAEQRFDIPAYSQRVAKNLENVEYIGIRRFLLQIPNNFEARFKDEPFSLHSSCVRKLFKPDDVKYCKSSKPPFLTLYRSFSIICRDVLAFGQKLSSNEKLGQGKPNRFNAMFRVFRFPYVPEYSKAKSEFYEDWFSLEDASTEINDSFSDDIRATQISCAFEILQNSLDFTLTSLPVPFKPKINHSSLGPEPISDSMFNPEMFLCGRIKIASKKRDASIQAKYLFFPRPKAGNFQYLPQPSQKPISTFSRSVPQRLALNYILRSRSDQDFTRQDPGSIHWVIMLKNFMHISQQALRYGKTGFNKASTTQSAFATNLPSTPLNDYHEISSGDFNFSSAQIPDFFAESLKHSSIASDLAELEYDMAPGSTSQPAFEYRAKVGQTAMHFVYHDLKAIRGEEQYEQRPALITTFSSQAKKIDIEALFYVESGVKNEFANVFSSASSTTEKFRHPGYPEWIDMDIDVLRKRADNNRDMDKFLLVPLRH